MHIESIQLSNFHALGIGNRVDLECNDRVNLFVGPNGTGKSTILRGLYYWFSNPLDDCRWFLPEAEDEEAGAVSRLSEEEYKLYRKHFECKLNEECEEENIQIGEEEGTQLVEEEGTQNRVPPIAPKTLLTGAPADGTCALRLSDNWLSSDNRYAEGGEITEVPLMNVSASRTPFYTDESNLEYEESEPWQRWLGWNNTQVLLLSEMRASPNSSATFMAYGPVGPDIAAHNFARIPSDKDLNELLTVVRECFASICPEILSNTTISLDCSLLRQVLAGETFYPRPLISKDGHSLEQDQDKISLDTIRYDDLSLGTQNALSWTLTLALMLAGHYNWEADWKKRSAILLIDEIENHLHPTWQRRVIPALKEHFPGLQIFATTHSPFVVAGLDVGQIHMLKREEAGRVSVTTNTKDIIGWTADEILRNAMGVDEPTDQLTADRIERLRQLRAKAMLTASEETELEELRNQIGHDLMTKGGPIEAHRERYADMIREFIRSRQSDLSQDGG